MDEIQAFSRSYAKARESFRFVALAAGLEVHSLPLPMAGAEGEILAIDVVLDGDPQADRLLLVTSGCHGVEGYCGSGVQIHALADDQWRRQIRQLDVAVLYVHALNPHGFSFGRRFTQENVDLNRNFHDFEKPLPTNPAYDQLHDLLVLDVWPPGPQQEAQLNAYRAGAGVPALQAALTGGQHSHADGLFFGGLGPAWSNVAFRTILRRYVSAARQVAWIDVHTGLGPIGWGERGFAGRDNDYEALARARAWWESDGSAPVTTLFDGSSVSSPMTGLLWSAIYDECPQAQITPMALEFGTKPLMEVLEALRAEIWLYNHPKSASLEMTRRIRQDLIDAFYVDTDDWKRAVIGQSRQALLQGAQGLASVMKR